MHKCREAPAPETPVDVGRQENYEANDDTVYEAGEDIDLLKTEKDLSDSVQELDLSRLAWLILHSFQSFEFDLPSSIGVVHQKSGLSISICLLLGQALCLGSI